MRAKLTFTNICISGFLSGDEELVRERMCCAIALALSLINTHTHTHEHSVTPIKHTRPCLERTTYTHTHTHSKHEYKMTIQTEKTKMASYVSYILVSNKRQLVQTVYY